MPVARALLPDLFQDIDWGGLHGFLYRRALVQSDWGSTNVRHFEDWDLLTRLGLHGAKLLTDSQVGCYYRQRAGSVSANRVGMTTSRARLLIGLHDQLRSDSRPNWFGLDLLKAEQGTYQGLVSLGVDEPKLLQDLLDRIKELQRREGCSLAGVSAAEPFVLLALGRT